MKYRYNLLITKVFIIGFIFLLFIVNFLSLIFNLKLDNLNSINVVLIFLSLISYTIYYVVKNIKNLSYIDIESNISLLAEYQKTIEDLKEKNEYILNRYHYIEKIKKLYKKDMEKSRKLQSHIMPKSISQNHKLSFQCFYSPLESVGGDYYDFIQLEDNKLLFIIADITGHGIEAGMITFMVKTAFNLLSRYYMSPSKILYYLNNILKDLLPTGYFLTTTVALIDTDNKRLIYSSASHPAFFVKRNENIVEYDNGDTILGLFPNANYKEYAFSLEKGDIIMFYTDGLTEASMSKNKYDLYGKERVKAAFSIKSKDIKSTLENIKIDFYNYLSYKTPDDDFTVVLFEVK